MKRFEQVGRWMAGGGRDGDVVISSRVRLARNAAGHRFVGRAGLEERTELAHKLRAAVEGLKLGMEMKYFSLDEMSHLERRLLVERHLISREHAEAEGPRGVGISADETVSIMVNEEDHLRMQVLQDGFDLDAAWSLMARIDDAMAQEVPCAFTPEYGFLTACPTNVGTGMRLSVMLHLPALAMTRELQRVFNTAAKIDFIVRGLYGEGTQSHGDLFQVSNQKTLGRSEEEILDNLRVVIPQIVRYERKVRDTMLNEHARQLEDRVGRAYGILCNARMMSSEESLHLLSQVRLGVNIGLVQGIDLPAANRLFILTRPAHLQMKMGRELESQERDIARADFLRKNLAGAILSVRSPHKQ